MESLEKNTYNIKKKNKILKKIINNFILNLYSEDKFLS